MPEGTVGVNRPLRDRPSRAAGSLRRRYGIREAAGTLIAMVTAVAVVTACDGQPVGPRDPGPTAGGGSFQPPPVTGTYQLSAAAVARVTGMPASALAASARAQRGYGQVTAPQALPSEAPKLSSGGRPQIMFICAEYWAPCAAERWALVMALSKFGTFTSLKGTTSAATGTSPDTPTFSFYGASYSSRYLTLASDEMETSTDMGGGEYPLLQPPTAQEMTIMTTWDRAPYTTVATSLPFAYLGGKFILTSAQYDASALSNMSFQAAASIMAAGKAPVATHADAAAGYLVADLCTLTRGQPATVCHQVTAELPTTTASPNR